MLAGTEIYSIPGTTAVTVLATPAADTRRVARWIKIYNPVGNGSIDVILRYNNGSITSQLGKLTIADGDYGVISGREEDDAGTIGGVDLIIHVALDNSTSRVLEAVAGSAPTNPLQVTSSWGDYQ